MATGRFQRGHGGPIRRDLTKIFQILIILLPINSHIPSRLSFTPHNCPHRSDLRNFSVVRWRELHTKLHVHTCASFLITVKLHLINLLIADNF